MDSFDLESGYSMVVTEYSALPCFYIPLFQILVSAQVTGLGLVLPLLGFSVPPPLDELESPPEPPPHPTIAVLIAIIRTDGMNDFEIIMIDCLKFLYCCY
jgi:hypothetical protein